MKLNLHALTFVILLVFILVSCEESPVEPEATLLTIQEINDNPGYAGFEPEADNYQPDSGVVEEIKNAFLGNAHFFYLFVKPSCTCSGAHKDFPRLVKVFRESGISESYYEIYSMLELSNKHPFADKFTINKLPSFIVMKSGTPVFSILDTLDAFVGRSDSISIEKALLQALRK